MVNVWFAPEFTVTGPDSEMLPPDPPDALIAKVEGGQFVVPIVNPLLTLAVPPPGPGFVAMKLREPVLAFEPMVNVAVSCVGLLTTVTMLMFWDMLTLTVVTPLMKPVPVTMTLSVCPVHAWCGAL